MASNANRIAQLAVGGGAVGTILIAGTLWAQSNMGARLLPHAFCISGSPPLLWMHVISDALIFLAYVAIPLALLHFVRRRSDIPFGWIGLLFGAFIVACGSTHAMEVWTIWQPVYWYSGLVKVFTAGVSLATAAVLVQLMPRLLALPSAAQLRSANDALEREVNSRRQAEAALHVANEELERRLKASEALLLSNRDLQQFASIAAHDLRSPLRSIGGYLGVIEARHGQAVGPGGVAIIHRAKGAVMQMDRLTDGLLTYARLDAQEEPMAEVDCNVLLDDCRHALEAALAESGAHLQVERLPIVLADRTQLLQLFQNLLSNAIKYSDGAAPEIRVAARRGEHEWVFSVSDNGIGIEPQHCERIFKIFERLHSQQEYAGSGIGLAVCQRIVDRMGGRIWVESEPGQGSTFYVAMPDRKR
jgi:signal transduction histidine kinase